MEEAEHVKIELTGGAGDFTVCPCQRELHAAARAGGHGQCGAARTGLVGRIGQAEVDHGIAIFAGAVDLQQHVCALGLEAIHTHKAGAGRARLEGSPAAQLVGRVTVKRQAKVHAAKFEANGLFSAAAHAGKGVQLVATQGEHAGFGRAAAGQSDLLQLAGFFKRKVAFDLHKAKGVNVHVATDLQQLAAATVQIHGQFAGRARGHVQHRGARAEVDH